MNKTINPELVKKALLIAKPQCFGEIDGAGHMIAYEWLSGPAHRSNRYCHGEFNPLTSDSDAWELEGVLMDERNGAWKFGKRGIYFVAWCTLLDPETTVKYYDRADESRGMLGLKCLSVMTGLPLYLEGP